MEVAGDREGGGREREIETERDRQRHTQRQKQRHRERQTERERRGEHSNVRYRRPPPPSPLSAGRRNFESLRQREKANKKIEGRTVCGFPSSQENKSCLLQSWIWILTFRQPHVVTSEPWKERREAATTTTTTTKTTTKVIIIK